jgi:hypothetical protein
MLHPRWNSRQQCVPECLFSLTLTGLVDPASASARVLSAPQPNLLVVPCNTSNGKMLRRPMENTQFTCSAFINVLKSHSIRISMDRKGRWRDNVFVERLWRLVKYEEVYLRAYESVSAAQVGVALYMGFFNTRRPRSVLNGRTPDAVYFDSLPLAAAA